MALRRHGSVTRDKAITPDGPHRTHSAGPPALLEGTYRVRGQRGRPSTFLVEAGHPTPRAALERLVPDVATYDGPTDPPAVPVVSDVFSIGGRMFVHGEQPSPSWSCLGRGAWDVKGEPALAIGSGEGDGLRLGSAAPLALSCSTHCWELGNA